MIKKLIPLLFLLVVPAMAQTPVQIDAQPGTAMRVCVFPEAGNPCTNQATIYSDSGLTMPISQPVQFGGASSIGFFVPSGNNYRVQLSGAVVKQILVVASGGGASGTAGGSLTGTYPNPALATTSLIYLRDDFMAGQPTVTFHVGDLGWSLGATGTGVGGGVAGSYPHVGIYQQSSGATASSIVTNSLNMQNATGSMGVLGTNTGWTMTYVFKLSQTTNTRMYIGTTDLNNGIGAAIANGFYLRYDTHTGIADSAFAVVTCATSVCTTGGTTYAVDTGWHRITFACNVSGQITFTFDANAPQTLTTNVPTVALEPIFTLGNDTTASASILQMDLFVFLANGVSR